MQNLPLAHAREGQKDGILLPGQAAGVQSSGAGAGQAVGAPHAQGREVQESQSALPQGHGEATGPQAGVDRGHKRPFMYGGRMAEVSC